MRRIHGNSVILCVKGWQVKMNSKNRIQHWDNKTAEISRLISIRDLVAHIIMRPGIVIFVIIGLSSLLAISEINKIVSVIIIIVISSTCLLLYLRAGNEIRSFTFCFYVAVIPIFLLFFFQSSNNNNIAKKTSRLLAGRSETAIGRVVSYPPVDNNSNGWSNVTVKLNNGSHISLTGPAEKMRYGAVLEFFADWQLPDVARNPGGYSHAENLASKGIYLCGLISGKCEVVSVKQNADVFLSNLAWMIRQKLYYTARNILEDGKSRLLTALLVGENKLLDPAQKVIFRRSGLSHLTSVSGTHVASVFIPLNIISNIVSRKRKQSAIIQICVLFLFGTVTGWKTGVMRSVIMLTVLIIIGMRDKNKDTGNILGLTGGLMIFTDYNLIMQVGFWLSFGAASVLALIVNPVSERIQTVFLNRYNKLLPKPVVNSLCAVILLQLVLMPLTTKMSGEVFWLAWLYNIPALLLTTLICTLSVFLIPILTVVNLLAIVGNFNTLKVAAGICDRFAGIVVDLPLELLLKIAYAGSSAKLRTSINSFNCFMFVGVYITLIWLWFKYIKLRHFHYPFISAFCGPCFLSAGLVISCLQFALSPVWTCYFLDVGQGDCLLIHNKFKDRAVLIDTGPEGSGYYDVLPCMTVLGIDSIDLALITHGHSDHVSGAVELMQLGLIESIALPKTDSVTEIILSLDDSSKIIDSAGRNSFVEEDLTKQVVDMANDMNVPIIQLGKGDLIELPDAGIISIISPDQNNQKIDYEKDVNNTSIISTFSWSDCKLLLLADLTEDLECDLMNEWQSANLIKVAHHGSKFTTGEEFINIVNPQHAVISSGKNNYGHPAQEVIDRLVSADSQVWRTDKCGCVIVDLFKERYTVRTYVDINREQESNSADWK
jgi:competence protein ComEC